MLEREFNRARASSALWEEKKASLGFDSYSYDESGSISNNDWMLIALSVAGGADFRDYLTMWGLPYSDKAAAQVESFEFDPVPRKFFAIEEVGNYCKTDDNGGMLYDAVIDMTDENATYPY